jgi:hypothetical protein
MDRRKLYWNVILSPSSPETGYLKAWTTSSPLTKAPSSSPEKLLSPRLAAAMESSGARSRNRTTVFRPAMPRYSAVT